ncbi:MAG: peptidylprolyl isomerase [Gemmataceae bacterium]
MGNSQQSLSRRLSWRRLVMGIGLASLVGAAFCFGRLFSPAEAVANPPDAATAKAIEPMPPPLYKSTGDSDYSRRAVAWIGDNEVVTREELGEYLIARFGAERLEMLVNKRIIDKACQEKGIDVTEAEIEAVLADDLKSLNMDKKQFVNDLLKKYHKSLYEWREDVIRPKLQMKKLAQGRVTATAEDLAKAYEAYYGERIECQMIMWPKNERHLADKMWDTLRKNPIEFDKQARSQASGELAKCGGRLAPIARHTTGYENMEQTLFSLEKGEVSPILETPEGFVVVKCLARLPADQTKKLEAVRPELEKEVIEKKTQLEIGKVFDELKKKANAKIYLKKPDNDNDYRQAAEQELRGNSLGKSSSPASKPPVGN